MSEELAFLKLIGQRLEEAGFPYMLSGSMALNYYATPRMTRDIDLVIELIPENVERFAALFGTDFYVDVDMIREAVKTVGMFNIIHTDWVIKADFIVRKNEAYRIKEFERRKRIEVDGVGLYLVSAEDLILSKLVWGKYARSELQQRDVHNLLTDVEDLDWEYMERWAEHLGVSSMLVSK